MIERILTVGGFTLVSRLTGFFRDILMAAVLGAGPIADAFLVAFRLPNHFRAIFAEGAFNAAFVPAYARIRGERGAEPARLFADRVFTMLFAAAPILLNLSMMATLALAAFFPTAGHAAAWGVFLAGCLEALMVAADLGRDEGLPKFRALRLDDDVRRFFKALGPAVLGSAGTQIALFADTIIASFLAAGAVSALYYADRINQLPIGVIGIAVGTVLLPEMARRIAVGDERGARRAQDRSIELALLLSIPCVAAFGIVPDLIMLALFSRGAFTAADASAAGATLAAYAIGLLPFVLLRAVSASFLARGDTATPVKALAVAVVINIALKILLMDRYAQVGLAFATSIGMWVNFILLIWFARRRGLIAFDDRLRASGVKLAVSGLALAAALLVAAGPVMRRCETLGAVRFVAALGILGILGAAVYGAAIAVLFGPGWLREFG